MPADGMAGVVRVSGTCSSNYRPALTKSRIGKPFTTKGTKDTKGSSARIGSDLIELSQISTQGLYR